MSKIIMVANQKGGVGKTTVSFELSAIYAQNGFKVLTVDLDGQKDFSKYAKADFKNKPTIRTILWAKSRTTSPAGGLLLALRGLCYFSA